MSTATIGYTDAELIELKGMSEDNLRTILVCLEIGTPTKGKADPQLTAMIAAVHDELDAR